MEINYINSELGLICFLNSVFEVFEYNNNNNNNNNKWIIIIISYNKWFTVMHPVLCL